MTSFPFLVHTFLLWSLVDGFAVELQPWRPKLRPKPKAALIQPKYQQDYCNKQDTRQQSATSQLYGLVPNLDGDAQDLFDSLRQDLPDLSRHQFDQLIQLRNLVVEWNERINLVSRKDCNTATVWERHILPCVAVAATTWKTSVGEKCEQNPLYSAKTVVDVGTGGGFPGLPLAILFPQAQFTLLDSVGKKLTAVSDMAQQLGLENVQTHHGRAEEWLVMNENTTKRQPQFDVATGRSVSALGTFCARMHHLLAKNGSSNKDAGGSVGAAAGGGGYLLYWIGGDVEQHILNRATADMLVASLLPSNKSQLSSSALDKRILFFSAKAVSEIAKESGLVTAGQKQQQTKRNQNRTANNNNNNKIKAKVQPMTMATRNNVSRGAWGKSRSRSNKNKNDEYGENGWTQEEYDGFQRYSSL